MQNQVIPNRSKVDTKYGVFEVLEYDFVRDQYFCYKKILMVIAVLNFYVRSI